MNASKTPNRLHRPKGVYRYICRAKKGPNKKKKNKTKKTIKSRTSGEKEWKVPEAIMPGI
jgi:hypothetical protein